MNAPVRRGIAQIERKQEGQRGARLRARSGIESVRTHAAAQQHGGDMKPEPGRKAAVYVLWDGEMMLDASLSECWRCVLDYPSWQNYSIVRHISGEQGQEGEVVMLRREEPGVTHSPYYAKTIKLELQRRVVWKTYPLATTDDEFFGIVDFRLSEQADQVCFRYSVLFEFMVPYSDESELHVRRDQRRADFEGLFAAILPALRELVMRRKRSTRT